MKRTAPSLSYTNPSSNLPGRGGPPLSLSFLAIVRSNPQISLPLPYLQIPFSYTLYLTSPRSNLTRPFTSLGTISHKNPLPTPLHPIIPHRNLSNTCSTSSPQELHNACCEFLVGGGCGSEVQGTRDGVGSTHANNTST